jgi:hypothetical protein
MLVLLDVDPVASIVMMFIKCLTKTVQLMPVIQKTRQDREYINIFLIWYTKCARNFYVLQCAANQKKV